MIQPFSFRPACVFLAFVLFSCASPTASGAPEPELVPESKDFGPMIWNPPADAPNEGKAFLCPQDPACKYPGIFFLDTPGEPDRSSANYLVEFVKTSMRRTAFQYQEINRRARLYEVEKSLLQARVDAQTPWYEHAAIWGGIGLGLGMLAGVLVTLEIQQ